MSNLLDQLRANATRDLTGAAGSREIEITYKPGMSGLISESGGKEYHEAVKKRRGLYYDKNMVLQEGMRLKTEWIEPAKKDSTSKKGKIAETTPVED